MLYVSDLVGQCCKGSSCRYILGAVPGRTHLIHKYLNGTVMLVGEPQILVFVVGRLLLLVGESSVLPCMCAAW